MYRFEAEGRKSEATLSIQGQNKMSNMAVAQQNISNN